MCVYVYMCVWCNVACSVWPTVISGLLLSKPAMQLELEPPKHTTSTPQLHVQALLDVCVKNGYALKVRAAKPEAALGGRMSDQSLD